jgi:hypothetical protein
VFLCVVFVLCLLLFFVVCILPWRAHIGYPCIWGTPVYTGHPPKDKGPPLWEVHPPYGGIWLKKRENPVSKALST